jgi:hypothetical protein
LESQEIPPENTDTNERKEPSAIERKLLRFGDSKFLMNRMVLFVLCFGLLGATLITASFASPSNPQTNITVDGAAKGAEFYGIGAISGGGGNSRYLLDYPPAQEAQIMDYMFKPKYGANLQLLKVEIGGDANSSSGAEPSIESKQGQINCNVGYEWTIAEQARALNPYIKLYALQWGAPGWVGSNVWTQADVNYVISWLNCARSHNLSFNYLGGWNEKHVTPAGVTWYEDMRQALDANGYSEVQIIADDEAVNSGWLVASTMKSNPTFDSAVSVVGAHDTCDWPSDGYSCSATATARALPQPLWESELGKLYSDTYGDTGGAAVLARSINNMYNDAGITGLLQWPLVDADPAGSPYPDRGLITADNPWSGQYAVNQLTWATAQTTQFVPQGWVHVNGANKVLGSSGSYNTYEATDKSAWSMVAQNTGSSTEDNPVPEVVNVKITGGLPAKTVHVWETDLDSTNSANWFVQKADITPSNGTFSYTVPAGYIVTFTTRDGGKGTGQGPAGNSPMPLPYTATEDQSQEPNYFAAQEGAFSYAPCRNGSGSCIQQMAPGVPVLWNSPSKGATPYGIVGDATWSDYTVSTEVNIPSKTASAGIIGRYSNQNQGKFAQFDGYDLSLSGDGTWTLNKDSKASAPTVLEKGTISGSAVNSWHTMALSFNGTTIEATIDGKTVTSITDGTYSEGMAGLESSWDQVQYNNFTVK